MNYKYFNLSIIIQVILIALTPLAYLWAKNQDYMLVTTYSLIAVWILQIFYLIFFLKKTNRDLARFFQSFRYKDSTLVFDKNRSNKAFRELYDSINDIIYEYGKVKIKKEVEHHFFQNTIQHVGVGLIAFNNNGDIKLCNKATCKLFNISKIINVEELNNVKEGISNLLIKLKPGYQKLIKLLINEEIIQLSVKATEFKIEEENIKLVSFQNIKTELEQGEVDAWQKLIRVLTHEIMNSVSPITLLSSSLINLYETDGKPKTVHEIDNSIIDNSLLGMRTINKRSKGLSAFVESYKSITKIPQPKYTEIKIKEFLNFVEVLFKNDFISNNISFSVEIIPEELILTADEKLIEQVIINLIKNSIFWLQKNAENKIIKLKVYKTENNINIEIIDNGSGIQPELIDDIFIPFFSTKENGSGIGLSLSRQIMRLHSGIIKVVSKPNIETVFTLKF